MKMEDWSSPDQVCGGFQTGNVFHCDFPEFIWNRHLHINNRELLTIFVAGKLWGHLWKGKNMLLKCDNKISSTVDNPGSTHDPFSQSWHYMYSFLTPLDKIWWKVQLLWRVVGTEGIYQQYLGPAFLKRKLSLSFHRSWLSGSNPTITLSTTYNWIE